MSVVDSMSQVVLLRTTSPSGTFRTRSTSNDWQTKLSSRGPRRERTLCSKQPRTLAQRIGKGSPPHRASSTISASSPSPSVPAINSSACGVRKPVFGSTNCICAVRRNQRRVLAGDVLRVKRLAVRQPDRGGITIKRCVRRGAPLTSTPTSAGAPTPGWAGNPPARFSSARK